MIKVQLKNILICGIVILHQFSYCQYSRIDSLQKIIELRPNDKNLYDNYFELGALYQKENLDSAVFCYEKASKIALLANNTYNQINVSRKIAWCNFLKGNYSLALEIDQQALIDGEKLKNNLKNPTLVKNTDKLIASINADIGGIYFDQRILDKAIVYYFIALKLYGKSNSKKSEALTLENIGNVYSEKNDNEKALKYYLKAIEINKELGEIESSTFANIGMIYFIKKDYPKALSYLFDAQKIDEKNGNASSQISNFGNIGTIYRSQNDFINGSIYMLKAIEISRRIKDKRNLALLLIDLAESNIGLKKYALAEEYVNESLKIALESGSLDNISRAHNTLYQIYQKTNKPVLALNEFQLYIDYKDSLTYQQNNKVFLEQEIKFAYEKKATADSTKSAEAKKVTIAKLNESEAKLKLERIFGIALFGGLILVIAFALFIFNRFKITKKQKDIIELQKHLVEEKQKEIMDSINYAKRLQNAILIPEANLIEHFADAFIIFKPKDVVSGDFYWFSESNDNKIIAVSDCTGHGVPGAFMSMLGYESLQDVALRENITTTSQALKSLDRKITEALNKSDKSFRDGMDTVLCAFSKKNNTVQYSGANRPLFQISEGILIEHKPDKNTIGGDIDNSEKTYTTKNIEYKTGDLFYLFTDGYPDQFGGPKGRKFMMKQLKELLISISSLSMVEQKEKIETAFFLWKENVEQVDDVCFIGLKV